MADLRIALEILQERREQEQKRLTAAETEAEYVSAQIDYDLAHRPENTKDLPGFRKRLLKANKEANEHREVIRSLDSACARLDGES